MASPVTDPALLAQLNAGAGPKPVDDPQLLAQLNESPSVAADVAKSGGVGLAKGAIGIAGAAGDVRHLASAATDYLGEKLGASPEAIQGFKDKAYNAAQYTAPSRVLADAPASADIQKKVEGVTGQFYKPQTIAGEYAQTAGEFAPGLIGGGEGLMARLATRVLLPAAASETAGQVTKGSEAEPYARVAAALMSPAITSIGRRAVTPLPASAERTALADTLRGEGVNLTAGQATGSKPLLWAESTLGDMPFAGGRPAQMMEQQGEQFTSAALRRVGEAGNRATPDVVDNAFRRIGNQFETIGARNHVAPDAQFVQDLRNVRDEYHNLVGPHARAPVIDNTIRDITEQMRANGGILNGDQYNAMTSRLARQARGAKTDPQLQETLQGLRESLDDAFERTLQQIGNHQDLAALREARSQYRNLMVVEKAATGAGSASAEGMISPSQLRNAVVQQNRRSYARGQGDFADLARSGEALLKPLPNSGTAPRQMMQHILTGGGGAIGGAVGGIPGAIAGIAAPAALGRALMSRPAQAYLGNQLLRPGDGDTASRALVRAIAATRGAPPLTGDPRTAVEGRQ